jgi:hypothetical protein
MHPFIVWPPFDFVQSTKTTALSGLGQSHPREVKAVNKASPAAKAPAA